MDLRVSCTHSHGMTRAKVIQLTLIIRFHSLRFLIGSKIKPKRVTMPKKREEMAWNGNQFCFSLYFCGLAKREMCISRWCDCLRRRRRRRQKKTEYINNKLKPNDNETVVFCHRRTFPSNEYSHRTVELNCCVLLNAIACVKNSNFQLWIALRQREVACLPRIVSKRTLANANGNACVCLPVELENERHCRRCSSCYCTVERHSLVDKITRIMITINTLCRSMVLYVVNGTHMSAHAACTCLHFTWKSSQTTFMHTHRIDNVHVLNRNTLEWVRLLQCLSRI